MIISEHIYSAFWSIVSNKLRAWLSMLWIIIWVASIIILLAFWEWTSNEMTSRFSSMWANLLTISPWWQNSSRVWAISMWTSSDLIDDDFVNFVKNINWVGDVSTNVSTNKQFIYNDYNTNVNVVWVTSNYKDLKDLTINNWRFINNDDNTNSKKIVVIWNTIAKNAFWDEDPIWKEIKLTNSIFNIVWVLWDNSSTNSKVFIPVSTAMSKLIWTHYYSSLNVQVENTDEISYTKSLITNELLKYLKIDDEDDATFSLSSMSEILESMEEMSSTMQLFLWWIASISLIVWWIWVMNIMLVSVSERTKEIWIRKALWATRTDILLQFLIESLIISVFAWIIWIWISFLTVEIINTFTSAIITSNSIILSFWSVVIIWIVFWILPAQKAANLSPIDALRYE